MSKIAQPSGPKNDDDVARRLRESFGRLADVEARIAAAYPDAGGRGRPGRPAERTIVLAESVEELRAQGYSDRQIGEIAYRSRGSIRGADRALRRLREREGVVPAALPWRPRGGRSPWEWLERIEALEALALRARLATEQDRRPPVCVTRRVDPRATRQPGFTPFRASK